MNRRVLGTSLIFIGFVIAFLAGLSLATANLTAGTLLLGIAVGLVVLVPVVGFGIYLRAQQQHIEAAHAPVSTMFQQRLMMDALREQRQTTFGTLGHGLEITPQAVAELIRSLIGLRVFSGYVHWQQEIVGLLDADQQAALTACLICGERISLYRDTVMVCSRCAAEYYGPSITEP